MSGYNDVETALATVIKLHADWSSADVSQGDYRIFTEGLAKAIVLNPGQFQQKTAASAWISDRWTINLELYIAFGGEVSIVASNIRTIRQTLIEHIDKYITLNGQAGVVQSKVVSGAEPEMWQLGAMYFWRQLINIEVEERRTVVYV